MTNSETTPTPAGFSLFDSIIHGKLRPHLPSNQNIKSITKRYQQAVFDQLPIHKAFPPKTKHVIKELINIRYPDLKIREGDTLNIKIDEQNNRVYIDNEDNTNVLVDIDIPPVFNVVGSYYLFLIEKEYDKLIQQFQSVILDTSQSPKRYVRHTFQVLKRLAVDAFMYSRELEALGYIDILYHTPAYTLHVLRLYIERSIEAFQFTFHPFLKDQLLSANQIHALCFGIDRLKRIQEIEQSFQKFQPLQKVDTSEKQPIKRELTWQQLFKKPEDADKILSCLKEDNFIADDNKWIAHPIQLYMIALYLVLNKYGYLKDTPFSAETLSGAFNQRFKMSFKSHKQWQPSMREAAENLVENFGLIPPLKP